MYYICMSPTIFTAGPLRFEIRTKEKNHLGRPHVHVIGPGAQASFDLTTGQCLASTGFRKKDLNRIAKHVAENLADLKECWNDYHK